MTSVLPYDAEVEYLESTGTQYIDTGLKLRTADTVAVTCYVNSDATANWYGVLGSYDGAKFFILRCYKDNTGLMNWLAEDSVTFYANRYEWITTSHTLTSNSGVEYESLVDAYLFAYNNRGSLSTRTLYRISAFSVIRDGVKILDFIPVRVGSGSSAVGYMYDRVSGKLFGNAGTGSFTIGPDVAVPVLSLKRYAPISARSYVQDGLVAMWDGIENAGWGVHDANAMTWKDLSPSGFNLTNQQGAFDSQFYWKDDCIYCNDGSGFRFFGAIGGVPQTIVDAVNSGDVTIEGVVRHLRTSNAGAFVSQLYEGANVNNLNIQCPVAGGGAAIREPWTTYGLKYGLNSTTAPLVAENPSYLCVVKRSDSSMSSTCVVNGQSYSATGTSGTANPMTTTGRFALMGMGAMSFWSGRHTIGICYAVRIYSRALTAAEIAHNYAIDKLRFAL